MIRTRVYAIGAALAGLALLAPSLAAAQSTDINSYALFAIQEIRAKGLKVVGGGNVGVNDPLGSLRVHSRLDAPGSEISADMVRTLSAASCGTLFSNDANPTICTFQHPFVTPFPNLADLSTACGFPDPFPACGANGPNEVVNHGDTLILTPGTYGTIDVKGSPNAGVLILSGLGTYNFCSLSIGRNAQLLFRSAIPGTIDVNVTGDITEDDVDPELGNGSFAGPESGSALGAHDIHIFAKGSMVNFSRRSTVQVDLCAPNAMLSVTQGAQLAGTFVAAAIHTEHVTVSDPGTTTTTTTATTTTQPSNTSTTITTTTTSSSSTGVVNTSTTQAVCQDNHCGNGIVEEQCGESCECAPVNEVRPSSCSGAMIGTPHDLPSCAVCKNCVLDESQCNLGSTTTTTGPASSSTTTTSPGGSSTTTTNPGNSSTTTTTTTPGNGSSTTTTTPGGGTCGDGHLDAGEECDGTDFGGATCPPSSPIGALLCTPDCKIDTSNCHASTTTTTQVADTVKEICGNCIDDDGNGLTDFEDPACCAQLQQFAMDHVHSKLKPKGSVSNFQIQSLLAPAELGKLVNPMKNGQDVFVQIKPTDGRQDIFCGWIPAKKFMTMHNKYMYWDHKGHTKTAKGLTDMTLIVHKNGRLNLRTHGPRVQMTSPGAGSVKVTIGFLSAKGNGQNLCSTTVVPMTADSNGKLHTP